jgi:pimeloyl-ACP methyl ester carboxylesterase
MNFLYLASSFLLMVFINQTSLAEMQIDIATPIHKNSNSECVILLHGLVRSRRSMASAAEMFEAYGYQTVNFGYPSTKKNIEALAEENLPAAIKQCQEHSPDQIHFVTHSMGGILLRYYLAREKPRNLGRVVMLSPPNQGSEVVDKLGNFPGFVKLNGPAGQQLGTDESSLPSSLGPVDYPVGVITGDRSINLILSMMIPGADDGKVSTERAKVSGMHDYLVAASSHPFIMKDRGVLRQTIHFLQNGAFYRRQE